MGAAASTTSYTYKTAEEALAAGKTQIDHWDGDRGNDRVGNLRWATPAQNRRNQGPGCNR